MTTIPTAWLVSLFACLALAVIGPRAHLPLAARACWGIALISIAVVCVSVGLRVEYGVIVMGPVQPHVAILIAPALWLGFQALLTATGRIPKPALYATVALVILGQVILLMPVPWSAEIVLSAANSLYAVLLTALLRHRPDNFVQLSADEIRAVRIAVLLVTGFVVAIIIADATIIIAILSNGDAGLMRLLTGASGAVVGLVILGLMIGLPLMLRPAQKGRRQGTPPVACAEEDQALLNQIDTLMTQSQIYTDPNLTLARLGRRLGCPAKAISGAINRSTGENVSRYINSFRIRHAADLLRRTDLPVTDIMLESGFQSKSSFNAEFRRILRQTPSDYRKHAIDSAGVRDRDFKRPTS